MSYKKLFYWKGEEIYIISYLIYRGRYLLLL